MTALIDVPDVVELIADELSDRPKDLIQLCLASAAFLSRARHYLFTKAKVHDGNAQSFLNVMSQNDFDPTPSRMRLMEQVKTLYLYSTKPERSRPWISSTLHVLHMLSNLRTLCLSGIDMQYVRTGLVELRAAGLPLVTRLTMNNVRFSEWRHLSVFVSACPSLLDLRLTALLFDPNTKRFKALPACTLVRLNRLHMDDSALDFMISWTSLDESPLEFASVELLNEETRLRGHCLQLFQRLANGVQHLHLDLERNFSQETLKYNTDLRTLQLSFTGAQNPAAPCWFTKTALLSLDAPHLHRLVLHCNTRPDRLSALDWGSIVGEIRQTKFAGLRSVRVNLRKDCPTSEFERAERMFGLLETGGRTVKVSRAAV